MGISGWIMGILIFLFALCCIVWNIIRLFYYVRCFKMEQCTDKQCPMKTNCNKWIEIYTEEDWLIFEKLLEKMEELQKDRGVTSEESMRQENNFWKILDNTLFIAVCLAGLSFIGAAIWIVAMGIMIKFR